MAKRKNLAEPVLSPTTAIGDSGIRMYGGIVVEEFLRELVGERGIKVYREMADNDPI